MLIDRSQLSTNNDPVLRSRSCRVAIPDPTRSRFLGRSGRRGGCNQVERVLCPTPSRPVRRSHLPRNRREPPSQVRGPQSSGSGRFLSPACTRHAALTGGRRADRAANSTTDITAAGSPPHAPRRPCVWSQLWFGAVERPGADGSFPACLQIEHGERVRPPAVIRLLQLPGMLPGRRVAAWQHEAWLSLCCRH